jgi:hypothetical protein
LPNFPVYIVCGNQLASEIQLQQNTRMTATGLHHRINSINEQLTVALNRCHGGNNNSNEESNKERNEDKNDNSNHEKEKQNNVKIEQTWSSIVHIAESR